MWKVVEVILNLRLTASITFHGVLHGFRAGRGKGTASHEAKMLHKLSEMKGEVLYAIFLDLQNVYVALDRDICLKILEGYVMGPQARCILWV